MNRRSFLSGLGALVAAAAVAPAVAKLLPEAGDVLIDIQGTQIYCPGLAGSLSAGDIITIQGVEAFNRVTHEGAKCLRQFVVTWADASAGTVSIYPQPVSINSEDARYANVISDPRSGAQIELVAKAKPLTVHKADDQALVLYDAMERLPLAV